MKLIVVSLYSSHCSRSNPRFFCPNFWGLLNFVNGNVNGVELSFLAELVTGPVNKDSIATPAVVAAGDCEVVGEWNGDDALGTC